MHVFPNFSSSGSSSAGATPRGHHDARLRNCGKQGHVERLANRSQGSLTSLQQPDSHISYLAAEFHEPRNRPIQQLPMSGRPVIAAVVASQNDVFQRYLDAPESRALAAGR